MAKCFLSTHHPSLKALELSICPLRCSSGLFVGLAYQGKKDIVFRFIIEYSSLRDFGP
jgi:hypothetical protein